MSFFKQFPKVKYDFNRQGVSQNMIDIFRSVRPLPSFVDNYSAYKLYEIKNGERPDIVSGRLYGTSQYYWTFFVINDFLHDGMKAWPMSQEDLFSYLAQFVTDKRKHLFKTVLSQRTRHFTVVLENIYQQHNASAVVRSCDIFGVQDIHVIEVA